MKKIILIILSFFALTAFAATNGSQYMTFTDYNAGQNLKNWYISSSGGSFIIATENDALNNGSTTITITGATSTWTSTGGISLTNGCFSDAGGCLTHVATPPVPAIQLASSTTQFLTIGLSTSTAATSSDFSSSRSFFSTLTFTNATGTSATTSVLTVGGLRGCNTANTVKADSSGQLFCATDVTGSAGAATDQTKWATTSTAITPNGGSTVGTIVLASSTAQWLTLFSSTSTNATSTDFSSTRAFLSTLTATTIGVGTLVSVSASAVAATSTDISSTRHFSSTFTSTNSTSTNATSTWLNAGNQITSPASYITNATSTTIFASSTILSNSKQGIGYTTGAGCAVTQATSRATGVICQGISGAITMNTTSLAAGAEAYFTVTDAAVAVGDVVMVAFRSGETASTGMVAVTTVAAGSFQIVETNLNAATADTGAGIINFLILKAVSS